MKILALVLFIVMYALIIAFPKRRVVTALITALVFLLTGILPITSLAEVINWNVLMMIAGTMILVYFFIESRMPNFIADILLDKSKNVMWVVIYMSLFAGIISAFIDNVATVLMVAPVGFAVCRKLKISPVPMTLAIAVSSNLQGAATLVGDTTSIMLGAYANMDFTDFFWMQGTDGIGRPGIFFAVELGAMATIPIMMFLFRKDKDPVEAKEHTVVTDYKPTFFLCAMVCSLIIASFFKNKPSFTNGLICLAIALIASIMDYRVTQQKDRLKASLAAIDTETLLLLTGLFIVIGGVTQVGIISDVANWIVKVGGNNLFLLYTIIVWGSVLISAFVDNIPYVATLLPVISSVTTMMGISPYLLYFGLLSGATLGGNLTPIGASANITAVGMLRKEGHAVGFKDFARIGIPFTITAVTIGYIFIWFIWR